jgi:hypothetical protein
MACVRCRALRVVSGLTVATGMVACGSSGGSVAPTPSVSAYIAYVQVVSAHESSFLKLVNDAGQACSDHPLDALCVAALQKAEGEGGAYQAALRAHPPAGCATAGGTTLSTAVDLSVEALALYVSGEQNATPNTIDAATAKITEANTTYQTGLSQVIADCKASPSPS